MGTVNAYPRNLYKLTPTEDKVMNLISKGFTNTEITEKLSVSRASVDLHRNNIYSKFGLNGQECGSARVKATLIYLKMKGLLINEQ